MILKGLIASTLLVSLTHVFTPQLPNNGFTDGEAMNTTKEQICKLGYTKTVRSVSENKKNKVFEIYKIDKKSDKFEVDHLIPLELGGSNNISNLWPQSYTDPVWNAHDKDRLENYLHDQVCKGKMDLFKAQYEISKDWIGSYKQHFGEKR